MKPRVAYVSTIVAGGESAVREAHEQFPQVALTNSGAASVSVFIGSGYYVLVLEQATEDFQDQFARFTGDSEVRRFFDRLRPYLEEPLPVSVRPADDFHETSPTDGQSTPTTARLPLVGEVFRWEMTAH
jgi:hypothetical protein